MAVYLINIFLILLLALILLSDESKSKNKKIYCGIVALQWTLISGLRGLSVGADTLAYKRFFDNADLTSWESIFSEFKNYLTGNAIEGKDPGYMLVQKIFRTFSDDYQLFLLFIGALFSIALAVWVYRNSKHPCLSFVIYSTLFYSFFAITGHRQTIATALIVLIGYEFIKKKQLFRFLIVALFAFLIHKSSIVFVPFYFLAQLPVNKITGSISLGAAGLIAILGNRVYEPLVNLVGYDAKDLVENEHNAGTYAVVLLIVCAAVLIFYPQIKKNAEHPEHIFYITVLTAISGIAIFQSQGFMRIQQYFSLFIMISIPELLLCVKKEDRKIVSLAAIAVLVLYIIRNNPQYSFYF